MPEGASPYFITSFSTTVRLCPSLEEICAQIYTRDLSKHAPLPPAQEHRMRDENKQCEGS